MAKTAVKVNDFDQGTRWAYKNLDSPRILQCLWRHAMRSRRFANWLDSTITGFPGEPERRCDTIAEFLSLNGTLPPVAAIAESMTASTSDMLVRFGEYCLRLRRELVYQSGKPTVPYQIVCGVFLLTGKAPKPWVMATDDFDCEISVKIKIVALRDLDAEVILREIVAKETSWGLLPFVPLMKHGNKLKVIEAWKSAVDTVAAAKHRGDIKHLALMYSQLTKRQTLWQQQLEGWQMQKRSNIVVEIEQRSEKIGEQRATLRNSRAFIIRVLKRRFGGRHSHFNCRQTRSNRRSSPP